MNTRGDEWDQPLTENIKAELVSCIGEEATDVLLEARGGTTVFIPGRIGAADHWLTELIGLEKAQWVAKHFGTRSTDRPGHINGTKILLPMDRRDRLHRRVLAGLLAGHTKNEVALHLGIHRRSVFRIARQLRAAGKLPPFEPGGQ